MTVLLPPLLLTGQFGRVYKAWLHTGSGTTTEVAVKTIRIYDPKEMKNFMREMAVMSQLMHPNIIHLHGVVKEGKYGNNIMTMLYEGFTSNIH